MIKNIVFDIGNVLVSFKPKDYLYGKFEDNVLADRLHKIIFTGSEWVGLDEGTITEEDAFLKFCSMNRDCEKHIMEIKNDWYGMLTPIEGSIKIVYELKSKGYKLYLLSNYHTQAFDWIYENYDFFKLFDGMIVSAKVKCLKPSPDIFKKLAKTYQILPEESVFIDDTLINIDAAEKLGFKALHFTSPDQLFEDLRLIDII